VRQRSPSRSVWNRRRDNRPAFTSDHNPKGNADTERVKGYLWHGNVFRAPQGLEDLAMDLDDIDPVTEGLRKWRKAVHEFQGYITANKPFIPNYGDPGIATARRSPQGSLNRRPIRSSTDGW
jgi:hypothetical protein